MDTNIEASKSLIERAMSSDKLSTAVLLIGAAHRLDNRLNVEKLEREYSKLWQERQAKERIKGE